jgi:hypothetical protein
MALDSESKESTKDMMAANGYHAQVAADKKIIGYDKSLQSKPQFRESKSITMFHRLILIGLVYLSLVLTICCSVPSSPASMEDQRSPVTGSISLMAFNMLYVAADLNASGDANAMLVADRTMIGSWEVFNVEHLAGGRIALKASNGLYVSADRNMGGLLIANRQEVGEWEQFEMMRLSGDMVALRSTNGSYVSADLNRGGALVADRTEIGDWERFTLIRAASLQ